jgi:DNA segregation ATPase FtsK/SpoIIIE, S-DNA-T family
MATRSGSAASRNTRPAARPAAARRRASRSRMTPTVAPDAPRVLIGVALMILGAATLIALLLPGEGSLTDMWRDWIAPWVGAGRRLLPFLFLAVGWWMAERAQGARGDWEWASLGVTVSFLASLGLIELLVPKSGGIIGKGLAHALPGLITTPGTAVLLAAVMAGGILLALDMSVPAVAAPVARFASEIAAKLFRPADAAEADRSSLAIVDKAMKAEKLGRESITLDPPRSKAPEDRPAPVIATTIPAAIPSQGPTSLTFAPPVAPDATLRNGGPLRDAPADAEALRAGNSIRDGAPVRGRQGRPADGPAGADGLGLTAPLAAPRPEYHLPPLALLADVPAPAGDGSMDHARNAAIIAAKLASFNIPSRVVAWNAGPVITQYEVEPSPEIKVSRIEALSDDLAMALAARTIRIEAPIPGKSVVGIEIPNKDFNIVALRRILEEVDFRAASKLTFALGRDVAGHARAADLAKMPHMLIAGATGSGKSVMVNALITSLLCNATPDEVRMVLMDLKRVELSGYNGLPHLMVPVITEPERAKAALKWAVTEMENRYRKFAGATARNIAGYNETRADPADRMPYLVIIIDELADLMMREGKNVEEPIVRLAQKARATGIHLVLATQRPSVNVVTGLIKANFPSRIAFAMASQIDSRTILDMPGAEDLIGRGDMLFQPADLPRPIRLQGVFVSDKEIGNICEHWRAEAEPHYDMGIIETGEEGEGFTEQPDEEADRLLLDAVGVIQEYDRASASLLQRRLKVGYARAARIIDQLEARGYIGPFDGSNARQVLRRDAAAPSHPFTGHGEDEV